MDLKYTLFVQPYIYATAKTRGLPPPPPQAREEQLSFMEQHLGGAMQRADASSARNSSPRGRPPAPAPAATAPRDPPSPLFSPRANRQGQQEYGYHRGQQEYGYQYGHWPDQLGMQAQDMSVAWAQQADVAGSRPATTAPEHATPRMAHGHTSILGGSSKQVANVDVARPRPPSAGPSHQLQYREAQAGVQDPVEGGSSSLDVQLQRDQPHLRPAATAAPMPKQDQGQALQALPLPLPPAASSLMDSVDVLADRVKRGREEARGRGRGGSLLQQQQDTRGTGELGLDQGPTPGHQTYTVGLGDAGTAHGAVGGELRPAKAGPGARRGQQSTSSIVGAVAGLLGTGWWQGQVGQGGGATEVGGQVGNAKSGLSLLPPRPPTASAFPHGAMGGGGSKGSPSRQVESWDPASPRHAPAQSQRSPRPQTPPSGQALLTSLQALVGSSALAQAMPRPAARPGEGPCHALRLDQGCGIRGHATPCG